jgi:hypothetical protein
VDNDGVMEFAGPTEKREGSERRLDVNFLAWQPIDATAKPTKQVADLPANSVIQVALQWQEAQSPTWKQSASEDAYRQPLAPLQIVVLRQRDPSGQRVPADLFDVVARSSGLPQRLENDPHSAVYSRTVRFQVSDQPGRYAIRIEGHAPDSIFPGEAAKLPDTPKGELRPKLVVEVVDPATRQKGQAVFANFTTGE